MIMLDDDGNFAVDSSNHLKSATNPAGQNFKSEVRCIQGTWTPDETFGRNALIWTLSQSVQDRCSDLTRIGNKYMTVESVSYNSTTKQYSIQAK